MTATYTDLLQEGERLAQQDRVGEAVQAFGRAAQLNPTGKEALTQLGQLFSDQGDLEGAAAFFQKATTLDDRDAFARLSLGLTLFELARWRPAAMALHQAVTLIEQHVLEVRLADDADAALVAQSVELEETSQEARLMIDECLARHAEATSA